MLRVVDTRSDTQTLLSEDANDPDVVIAAHTTDWSSKFTKTVILSFSFLALGLCIAIPGPTLLDLGERVQTDTEHMSMIFTARSVGYLLGSIIGGFLFDHFDQQILMFYTLILSAMATIMIPWCTLLIVLAAIISFQGFSMGILSTGGNVFCIQLWKHKSAPYMQGLHFAFAIGAFIAPLLASPFFSSVLLHDPANNSLISSPQGISPVMPNIPDFALLTHPSDQQFVKRRDVTSPTPTSNISTSTVASLSLSNSDVSNISSSAVNVTEISPAKPERVDERTMTTPFHDEENTKYSNNSYTTTKVTETRQTHTEVVDEDKLSIEVSHEDGTPDSDSSYISTSTITSTTELSQASAGFTENTRTSNNYDQTSTMTAETKTRDSNEEFVDDLDISTVSVSLDISTASASTVNQSDQFNSSITTETPNTFGDFVHNTLDAVTNMSRIQFSYVIIGFMLIVNAFMFLVLYCKDKQRAAHTRWTNKDRHGSTESMSFRVAMLVVLFLFFYGYVGMEVTFGGLLSTFVVGYLNWSKTDGAIATAVFWGSVAGGRCICIFIAKYFKPHCMLATNTILVVIGALVLSFGIQMGDTWLWVGTVTIGLGMSSIFPTGISWADHYFPLTGKATAVFVVGSALGEMTIPVLTGYLYENKDKMALMYMMVGVGLFCAILYVILQCIASHKKRTSSSSSKVRFVRLDDEDNVSMDSVAASYGSSGYAEQTHKRKGTNLKSVDTRSGTDQLIDVSD